MANYNGYQQSGLQQIGQGMGMGAGGFGGQTGNNWYPSSTTNASWDYFQMATKALALIEAASPAPLDMKEPLLPYLRSRTKAWLDGVKLK